MPPKPAAQRVPSSGKANPNQASPDGRNRILATVTNQQTTPNAQLQMASPDPHAKTHASKPGSGLPLTPTPTDSHREGRRSAPRRSHSLPSHRDPYGKAIGDSPRGNVSQRTPRSRAGEGLSSGLAEPRPDHIIGAHIGPYVVQQALDNDELVDERKYRTLLATTATGTLHVVRAFALKVLRENPKLQLQVEREVLTMKYCAHPHLIELDKVILGATHMFLVTRYCEGGELFELLESSNDRVATAGGEPGLPLPILKRLFAEVLTGVKWLHSQGLCHRDIKLEHVFLDADNKVRLGGLSMVAVLPSYLAQSKLHRHSSSGAHLTSVSSPHNTSGRLSHSGMGGSSMEVEATESLKVCCGSKHYASPEIVDGKEYDGEQADAWSCGILLFAMATGSLPFVAEDENSSINGDIQLFERIRNAEYYLAEHPSWGSRFPPGHPLRKLVMSLLQPDTAKRMKVGEALQHPFLTESEPHPTVEAQARIPNSVGSASAGGTGGARKPVADKRKVPASALQAGASPSPSLREPSASPIPMNPQVVRGRKS